MGLVVADVPLHIELQEGFVDDRVVVSVNGTNVYDSDAVATRFQIGLADQVEVAVPIGRVETRIAVPSRDAEVEVTFEAQAETWLGVSYLDERLSVELATEMFRYA